MNDSCYSSTTLIVSSFEILCDFFLDVIVEAFEDQTT